MKRIKALLFILVLFLITPLVVNADCESDFKEVEDQFKISYVYNKDTDDFTITLVNPDTSKYSWGFNSPDDIVDIDTNENGSVATYTIKNYKKDYYKYSVLATYGECYHKQFKLGVLKLERKNPYASDPLCEGNEDFVLCQENYEKRIDEEEFKARIEAYEASKSDNKRTSNKSNDNNKKETKEQTLFESILEYAQTHIAIIIVAIVVIIAIIIIAIIAIKKNIKSRRLE